MNDIKDYNKLYVNYKTLCERYNDLASENMDYEEEITRVLKQQDKLVEENQKLKERIKDMEDWKQKELDEYQQLSESHYKLEKEYDKTLLQLNETTIKLKAYEFLHKEFFK